MKLSLAVSVLLAAVKTVTANIPEIPANSILGKNLLHHARRVEEEENEAEEEEWQEEYNWISGYSVKFQGCHSIKQWNDNADENEDVKIETMALVRFRLCPEETCSSTKAAGCTAGYGEYIIEMSTFMESYMEAARQRTEYECETFLNNQCGGCEDDGNQGDDFNAEYCEYDCFLNNEMTQCIDRNPYEEEEEGGERFEIDEYMECAQLNIDNGRRKLDENQEEAGYYVGPYCSEQGGSVYMGLFTEDTCTTKAVDITFQELMGFALPYETTSLVSAACLSCLEPVNADEQNDNDQQDEDPVSEQCEMLYQTAGKCETNLPSGMVTYPNTNACNYMDGVKIVRQDGIISVGKSRASPVATAFIIIAAGAFCAMAFYVWYLRTRLGVKQNTLL